MNDSLNVLFGFLGGSVMSVEGGYKVLPKHPSGKVFKRLADAKWFLALQWCEQSTTPAAIMNNTEQFSFQNALALSLGITAFIPEAMRTKIFRLSLELSPREIKTVSFNLNQGLYRRSLDIQGIEIDPRYGKVALIRERLPEYLPTKVAL